MELTNVMALAPVIHPGDISVLEEFIGQGIFFLLLSSIPVLMMQFWVKPYHEGAPVALERGMSIM
ncbi:MAG: hypothetical protein F6K20_22500 [Moorea sp. SIO2C4]|nr:hypothetical protein [Moorena sp. SIO2C4]